MYYFSNKDTYTTDELRVKLMPNQAAGDTSTSDYQLNAPLRLQLITFHPNMPKQYYLMTSLEPDFSIYMSMEKQEAVPLLSNALHHHNFYEFMFILEGNVYQIIENQRHLYTSGSCCLLNKNVRHTEEYREENGAFRILFLQLTEEYLRLISEIFSMQFFSMEQTKKRTDLEAFLQTNLSTNTPGEKDYVDFIPQKDADWIAQNTHKAFDELANILTTPTKYASFDTMRCVVHLLQLLVSRENYTTTPVRIGTHKENRIFEEIKEYMELSFGRISRNELSQILHYSGSHLNHIVQKYTGLSISEYGMSVCMKEAARLLKTTDAPIQDIAEELRFTNRTHFYRKFEEIYHATPAQYRKNMVPGTITSYRTPETL